MGCLSLTGLIQQICSVASQAFSVKSKLKTTTKHSNIKPSAEPFAPSWWLNSVIPKLWACEKTLYTNGF